MCISFVRSIALVLALFSGSWLTQGLADQSRDLRAELLFRFFEQKRAPARVHVVDFLEAADRYALDWRLLPSIAHVESGGGKAFKNNNIFGWGSAELKFPSVQAGIYIVAERLAKSKLYKDKNLEGILRTYNKNAEYTPRVLRVMRAIGPRTPEFVQN